MLGVRLYTPNQLDSDTLDLLPFSEGNVYVNMPTDCFTRHTDILRFKVEGDGFRVQVFHETMDL
jgi:hypothetical protein